MSAGARAEFAPGATTVTVSPGRGRRGARATRSRLTEPITVRLTVTCARLSAMAIVLSGDTLTLDELLRVARGRAAVELTPEVAERVRAGRAIVERLID